MYVYSCIGNFILFLILLEISKFTLILILSEYFFSGTHFQLKRPTVFNIDNIIIPYSLF